jgi:hypothetical protein
MCAQACIKTVRRCAAHGRLPCVRKAVARARPALVSLRCNEFCCSRPLPPFSPAPCISLGACRVAHLKSEGYVLCRVPLSPLPPLRPSAEHCWGPGLCGLCGPPPLNCDRPAFVLLVAPPPVLFCVAVEIRTARSPPLALPVRRGAVAGGCVEPSAWATLSLCAAACPAGIVACTLKPVVNAHEPAVSHRPPPG